MFVPLCHGKHESIISRARTFLNTRHRAIRLEQGKRAGRVGERFDALRVQRRH
jgi:hypothetical protein